MKSRRLEVLLSGIQAEVPLAIAVIPFGMIYGALALNAGMPAPVAQAMSSIVFAGSAQFITTQLVREQVPGLVIIMTIAVVNLRHALYSASLAPYLEKVSAAWKVLLAYLLTDEAYAVTITHYRQSDQSTSLRHWFLLGAGLTLWASWQASTALGLFLGAVVPEAWSLDFTLALTFIALLIPMLKDRPGLTAALAAGITAILVYSLPLKLGILLAALVGILTGTGLAILQEKPQ